MSSQVSTTTTVLSEKSEDLQEHKIQDSNDASKENDPVKPSLLRRLWELDEAYVIECLLPGDSKDQRLWMRCLRATIAIILAVGLYELVIHLKLLLLPKSVLYFGGTQFWLVRYLLAAGVLIWEIVFHRKSFGVSQIAFLIAGWIYVFWSLSHFRIHDTPEGLFLCFVVRQGPRWVLW
ncbi:uncharacterized protein IWZ02DRAFT_77826 [Phyllosticta citriasiana]|uniref:uncharacterized protein n=1 Tax=Phyllosticta citriasiana TaxID=595635 RepID=UPI0030FDE38D